MRITLFEETIIRNRVNYLFENYREQIDTLIENVFVNYFQVTNLNKEEAFYFFKIYFHRLILNEAIEIVLSGQQGHYNVLMAVFSLLSDEEKIIDHFFTESVLNAFCAYIMHKK